MLVVSFTFSLIDAVSFQVNKGFLPNIPTPPKYPEKILFCGWRRDIHDMIMVLTGIFSCIDI
jgi:hypothetical protein